jgi:hypothetical protein
MRDYLRRVAMYKDYTMNDPGQVNIEHSRTASEFRVLAAGITV